MKISTPSDLFFDQLRDLYSVESQVILTLPDLAEQAADPSLRKLIGTHEGESLLHKDVIVSIFERHGQEAGGDICKAMKGLIDGGNEHLVKTEDAVVRDLLLVAHCGRIEHYEIAAYVFTASLARSLGLNRDAEDLEAVLKEERETVLRLSEIGEKLSGSPMNSLI